MEVNPPPLPRYPHQLPWDTKFVIESLSDSTLYWMYYTVAHKLHSDVYGEVKGSANIDAKDMTDEVRKETRRGRVRVCMEHTHSHTRVR